VIRLHIMRLAVAGLIAIGGMGAFNRARRQKDMRDRRRPKATKSRTAIEQAYNSLRSKVQGRGVGCYSTSGSI
jgi:hypothetical protein